MSSSLLVGFCKGGSECRVSREDCPCLPYQLREGRAIGRQPTGGSLGEMIVVYVFRVSLSSLLLWKPPKE